MKTIILSILLVISSFCFGQKNETIGTIDFVKTLNDNTAEIIYYYENNWKVLREMAMEKEYIHSYQLMEMSQKDEGDFDIILITTYANEEQYGKRELHFQELIKAKGELKLMNDKKPGDFRKIVLSKENVKHRE